MNENNQTPARPACRADVAWGRISRSTESSSVVEDRLAAIVDQKTPSTGQFRVDVIHIDPDEVTA